MTFSIVAWDPDTGMTGVAVSTANLAVGAVGYHVRARAGTVVTQADPHPMLGQMALRMLEEGVSVDETLQAILQSDKEKYRRQIQMVDSVGRTAAWTGHCVDWAGHQTYPNFSVAGNMLVGGATIQAMAEAYQAAAQCVFPERLMRALEAGQAAGGDKRGRQSAALYVVSTESYADIDLRVDDHQDPVVELRRIYEESKKPYYRAFRHSMPTRKHPHGVYETQSDSESAAHLVKNTK